MTAGFLHGGLFHIVMNSWVLCDLGAAIERFFGNLPDAGQIYFVSNVTGFLASSFWIPGFRSAPRRRYLV